jgi:hypothetical protein
MHEKSILTLEYPKIMEKVAREAAFSASKELVMALQPTPNLDEARHRLAYTTEAYNLIELRTDAGIQGARDIRQHLERAAREGILTPSDLLAVLATIQSAIHIARLTEKLDTESFPLLHQLGADMPQRPHLARRIASCAPTSVGLTSVYKTACARWYTNLAMHYKSPSLLYAAIATLFPSRPRIAARYAVSYTINPPAAQPSSSNQWW